MSETLAGVTLLAMGNGSPDIFASISNYSSDTELLYTELLGGAAFVTGLVAGIVIVIRPFKIVARNYTRDVLFFVFALILINQFMGDYGYALWEGLVTIMIYLAYLAYVFIDHRREKRQLENLRRISANPSLDGINLVDLQSQVHVLEENLEIQIKRKDSLAIEFPIVFRKELTGGANDGLFQTFKNAINPIELGAWEESGLIMRSLMILKASG